jgi:large repetitive protein
VTILGNGTFCQQAGDTLTANIAPGTYNWSTGETTQSIVVTQSGQYVVIVVDGNGCMSSDTFAVVALPSPTAAFNFNVNGTGLTYTFADQSTGNPTTYSWTFGDGNTSTSANPSHTYAANGIYVVTLIVTNACGSDTTTQTLTVTDVQGSLAFATVSLSPNPAHGQFAFEVTGMTMGTLQVEMLDIQGKRCNAWSYTETAAGIVQQVDASKLAKGVYFLRFTSDNLVEMRKIVLE